MTDCPNILVGIPTYKRPKMLANLLDSLAKQTILNTNIVVEIVIVDNDKDQGALTVFDKYSDKMHCRMQYLHEVKRGIPFARNKVLDHAIDRQAEFIAFIDDDETADPDWLLTLHQIITTKPVDAVQGPVISLLPENAPRWAIKDREKKSKRKEGEHKTTLATNNVMFSSRLIVEKGLRFDERFALSGGEDVDFFQRSARLGNCHIWTNRALVYEKIPETRLTLKWEFQRSYSVGATNTFSSVQQKGIGYGIKRYMLKVIARLLLGPLILFTAGLLSAQMRLLSVRWIGSALGHFLGFFGILGSEYSYIHGD